MDDITPNQRAFLAVAEELRRLENSLQLLDAIDTFNRNIPSHSKAHLRHTSDEMIYTEEVQPLAGLAKLLGSAYAQSENTTLDVLINKLQARYNLVKDLADAYLRGEDIVVARLSKP